LTPVKTILRHLLGPAVALTLSFLVGAVFIVVLGKDPIEVFARLFSETLGTSYGIGQVLFRATPLMFTGLSAGICFKAGLFNIGAEGQLTIGAFLTALAGVYFAGLPAVLLIPVCCLAGMVGGAVWGAIPGALKARFGAHEVINTIMMNFIAVGIVSYFIINSVGVPATVHTPEISPAAVLPRLEAFTPLFLGSPVNVSLFLAIGMCLFGAFVMQRTRWGYEVRTVGMNPAAAEYGGISIRRNIIVTFAAAGACAGLVGSNFVMGYKHYFELGFSDGIGFIGIAVALLARNNFLGIIVTSLFFGMLEYGSLTINTIVPKELSNILQAIVIIFVIMLTAVANRWFKRRRLEHA
jgi:simple sugar transport system permease protein